MGMAHAVKGAPATKSFEEFRGAPLVVVPSDFRRTNGPEFLSDNKVQPYGILSFAGGFSSLSDSCILEEARVSTAVYLERYAPSQVLVLYVPPFRNDLRTGSIAVEMVRNSLSIPRNVDVEAFPIRHHQELSEIPSGNLIITCVDPRTTDEALDEVYGRIGDNHPYLIAVAGGARQISDLSERAEEFFKSAVLPMLESGKVDRLTLLIHKLCAMFGNTGDTPMHDERARITEAFKSAAARVKESCSGMPVDAYTVLLDENHQFTGLRQIELP